MVQADNRFEYFYGVESEAFSFLRIPRLLITDPRFSRLSAGAKLLYGLLLDRMGLSMRNGWYDDEQRVFIYYTLDEIMEDMNCGHDKATKLLRELDSESGIGLIERVRQGLGKPTLIYVKNFMSFSAPTPAPTNPRTHEPMRLSRSPYCGDAALQTATNPHSGLREFSSHDCGFSAGNYNNQNHTEKNYTDFSYTDLSIHPSNMAQDEMDEMDGSNEIEEIKEQIEYDVLAECHPVPQLDCIVQVFRKALHSPLPYFIIDGHKVPANEVRNKFLSLNRNHVEYVFDALNQSKTKVKNWPSYLLTSLYHTPDTMDFFYDAWVRHDQAVRGGDTYAAAAG